MCDEMTSRKAYGAISRDRTNINWLMIVIGKTSYKPLNSIYYIRVCHLKHLSNIHAYINVRLTQIPIKIQFANKLRFTKL